MMGQTATAAGFEAQWISEGEATAANLWSQTSEGKQGGTQGRESSVCDSTGGEKGAVNV